MRPDLQERFMKVAHNLDRLEQIRNLVEDHEGTSPRSLIASAAVAGAEFLAAATGHSQDSAAIHRAYEEIFAAIENSESVTEMLTWNKVASADRADRCSAVVSNLQRFRRRLATMGVDNG
jgi:hypothetical protein